VRRSGGIKARRLVDDLIDRAHSEWPSVSFILAFPTGERVLLPHHRAGLAPCAGTHHGYFSAVIGPFCTADPLPRGRGTCRLMPISGSGQPPEYRLELRSGAITRHLDRP